MSKNLIIESEYASGVAYSNERRYYAPIALTEKESYSDDERDVIAYEVPENTEIYELNEEHVYEDHYNWSLRKYNWGKHEWTKLENGSVLYDEIDHSVYESIKGLYHLVKIRLYNKGYICH